MEDLFVSENDAITAVNGIYNVLPEFYQSTMLRLTGLASDDGWTWRNELETDIFIVEQSFNHSRFAWQDMYTGITRANLVIHSLANVPEWSSTELRDASEGQARFLRALYYFNLVRLFGEVPLIEDVVGNKEDASLPRSSVSDVYSLIKSDLTNAIALLPISYSGGVGLEEGRATKYAAQLLKAYVHLEIEEWSDAEALASQVIGSGTLLDFADNFNGSNENGTGSIFEVQYASLGSGVTANQNHWYAPPSFNGDATTLPTDDNLNGTGGGPSSGGGLVQAFEVGDLRKDVTVSTYGIPNFIDATQPDGSLYFVNKFYNASVAELGNSSWNVPILRYADALLVSAEALNESGYVADGTAFSYLNAIRTNAGLNALTSADLPDQSSFRDAIRQERRVEFAFEYKRFFDLNRWGILEDRIQPQLNFLGLNFPSAKASAHPITGKNYYLYPVPDVEFVNNPVLGDQNPGYD
ncbi:RagB/SusD family nutrient uptake outer membrane protein [Seonamhaeicola sp.]|uniref:RagB/SusD family nutrient uptake outer membrane protein n=1 Tax=Seonamhaeicola sp. TaxID=1912245 RepID=UPI00261C8206|nr:RagB/SusD family nutrient uptake outer membrane protein [Seonamhaeicola sp.]